jgi:hypothetical protein
MLDGPSIPGLTHDVLVGLTSAPESPCLSVHLTTHRRHPENLRDAIQFRMLVMQLRSTLHQSHSFEEVERLLQPFEAIASDEEFWSHTLDGLIVLSGPGVFRALRLPQPVSDLAVVGASYHTRPLRRFLLSGDRYQVLGLSLHRIRLFEGNRRGLHELKLSSDVSRRIRDALSRELTAPDPTTPIFRPAGEETLNLPDRHALEVQVDAETLFRAVDQELVAHYSNRGGLPLALAALPEHEHRFRNVSQNPHLLPEGIRINPDDLSSQELGELAWPTVAPRYEVRLASLFQEFSHAYSKGYGSDVVADVATAATSGRVGTVMIDSDLQVAGQLERPTGRIELTHLSSPHVRDLLDDLGALVAAKGGSVLVIPSHRMPSATGVAAIYRY